MKTAIKRSLQSLMLIPMLALGVSAAMPVLQPVDAHAQIRDGIDATGQGDEAEAGIFEEGGIFETIVNALLFIIGAVAVVMLIFGGFRYVTSGGDSNAVTSAKNTILYAVIGIIVAVLAYAILDFVLDQLGQ